MVRPLTVSELTRRIKESLEAGFSAVSVEGELSNVRPSSAGHLYFTIKDDDAMISAVLFRGRSGALTFTPEDGQQVVAHGGISVYARRGNYQLIVERMELAGLGRILAMLEERKQRLALEGLFDASRKRPLPLLPSRVAVVTSPTGAALRDILQVLRRRNAGIDVVVCPTPVQGEGAGERIARMIGIASRHRLGDVIIVGRGGGSIEDLLPFSDEVVVRAIAASEVPVISAVGHEIDWAISDYAADLRAPTPSAAAEVVASSRADLVDRVRSLAGSAVRAFAERYRRSRLLLRQFSPAELQRSYWILAQPVTNEFDRVRAELVDAMSDRVLAARHRLDLLQRELDSCSPFEVLARGYAIARGPDGRVITDVDTLAENDPVSVRVSRGGFSATVTALDTQARSL